MTFLVFLLPFGLLLLALSLKLGMSACYVSWVQEDSVLEYLQALIFLASSLLAIVASLGFFRQRERGVGVLFVLLGVGLAFVAAEEVSWGQRLLDISNPEYFRRHNVQREITVHNLKLVQPLLVDIYILVSAYGAFAWLVVGILGRSGAVGPAVARRLEAVAAPWYISSYFLCSTVVFVSLGYVARPVAGGFMIWRDQEPAELLLALGFLLFTAIRVRGHRTAAASALGVVAVQERARVIEQPQSVRP